MLEAYPGYWRHVPYVKRLVMKSVPEGTTRVAMLKSGEADIAYALDGPEAEDVKRDPRLQLVPSQARVDLLDRVRRPVGSQVAVADKRLRLAVNYALNRKAINEAACLGFCPPAGVIVPARDGLRAAGRAAALRSARRPSSSSPRPAIPNGLDAGEFVPIPAVLHGGRGRGELPERGRASG